MRSAPTLKIWITPWASVAMLEKLALLKMASCSAPDLSSGASIIARWCAERWRIACCTLKNSSVRNSDSKMMLVLIRLTAPGDSTA